jgi:hypothetical protein
MNSTWGVRGLDAAAQLVEVVRHAPGRAAPGGPRQ